MGEDVFPSEEAFRAGSEGGEEGEAVGGQHGGR